ncbi:hypothetical protein BD560DRAFT_37846 [Blakeslea trispora]|nr:hypothetical protein BD560DRAFT_37846 [Blakeslea trispora]
MPQVIRSASTNRLTINRPLSTIPNKDAKKAQRPRSVNDKASSRGLSNGGSSRLLQEAILDEQKRNKTMESDEDVPPVPTISRSTLLQDFKKGIASSSRIIKGTATTNHDLLTRRQNQLKPSERPLQNRSISKASQSKIGTEKIQADAKVSNKAFKSEDKEEGIILTSDPARKQSLRAPFPSRNNAFPRPSASTRPRPSISTRSNQLQMKVVSELTNTANLKNSHSTVLSWR